MQLLTQLLQDSGLSGGMCSTRAEMKVSRHINSSRLFMMLFGAYLTIAVAGYRPVIIIHGLNDGPKQFNNLVNFIIQAHPGTSVTVIDLFDNLVSLRSLWKQVDGFRKAIYPIMQSAQDGVHVICFSQGGAVCRGILAMLPNHNVHSLIFLSSPLAGQYGETDTLRHYIKKSMVYRLCYSYFGQTISVCNYWNDPHQRARYLKSNNYLPLLNGETTHPKITQWRERFLRIKKLVLIGGPDDGVIAPWQSSLFGFYDENETVVEMKNQEWYVKDAFGLKTLDARGDVVQCVFSGVHHTSWHSNQTVFRGCVEEWLT